MPSLAPRTTRVLDSSALHPPAGARVAIIEFEDMECPDCARANPLLKEAAEKYHIPWVRHDFPLPLHNWSFNAAVNARWFDTKSKKLGDDYRDYIFANQLSIETPAQLAQFTEQIRAERMASHCLLPSIRRANSQAWSRPTTHWASASASSTRPPSGCHCQQQGRAVCRSGRPQQTLPAHRPGVRRYPRTLVALP